MVGHVLPNTAPPGEDHQQAAIKDETPGRAGTGGKAFGEEVGS